MHHSPQSHSPLSPIGLALATLLALTAPAFAGKIRVPKDAPTIREAVERAKPGDRIVVTRGQYIETLVIHTPNIEIVTRRAKQHADIHVRADGVTIRGLKMEGGSVLVHEDAEGVTVMKNRFRGGQVLAAGNELTVRKNRFERTRHMGAAEIYADNATVSKNKFNDVVCAVVVFGDEPLVADNKMSEADEAGVFADSDDAVVEGNSIRGVVQMDAITVLGDDADVSDNRVQDAVGGVRVEGGNARIDDNNLQVGSLDADLGRAEGCPAITVITDEPGTEIIDNEITHLTGTGIHVQGTGVTISGNDVLGVTPQDSIEVIGDTNVVTDNHVAQTRNDTRVPQTADEIVDFDLRGDGIEVQGDGNRVEDNVVAGVKLIGVEVKGDGNQVQGNQVALSQFDGVAVYGSDNLIQDNRIDSAGHDGAVVDGSSNEFVGNEILRTEGCGLMIDGSVEVRDCTVTDCGLGGLVNHSDAAEVTDSTFQANSPADVINLGTFNVFTGNTFGTMTDDPSGLPEPMQQGPRGGGGNTPTPPLPPMPEPPGFPQFR